MGNLVVLPTNNTFSESRQEVSYSYQQSNTTTLAILQINSNTQISFSNLEFNNKISRSKTNIKSTSNLRDIYKSLSAYSDPGIEFNIINGREIQYKCNQNYSIADFLINFEDDHRLTYDILLGQENNNSELKLANNSGWTIELTNSKTIRAYTLSTNYISSTSWKTLVILPYYNTFSSEIHNMLSYVYENDSNAILKEIKYVTGHRIVTDDLYNSIIHSNTDSSSDVVEFLISNGNRIMFICNVNYNIAGVRLEFDENIYFTTNMFTGINSNSALTRAKENGSMLQLILILFKLSQQILIILIVISGNIL